MTTTATLDQIRSLAKEAHAGQTDKIGSPYFWHVEAVANGLAPFGVHMQMAGLLHDVIEDTKWTAQELLHAGVPGDVLLTVLAVTNVPCSYEEKIRFITRSREATLVKIADNAHNSREDRAKHLPEDKRKRLARKYSAARKDLWAAVSEEEVRTVVSIVNPSLLKEIPEHRTA
ncbi:phosphohydrolase [Streptomyces sp. 5-10]|uniref:phosphohydrolase n=1 Tax=Streptomyces sp. 5-10 TaxID=878925 RepID=UPI00168ADE69|nr:phosphohydrolase [Streptomyces sp. 5-10]MBD3004872.1 phosphohydrolase [Streptomyces sp. 5-10]